MGRQGRCACVIHIHFDSAGVDGSGPIQVETRQSQQGVSELKITAFGKQHVLSPSQLTALNGRAFNSIGLSYSRGYANFGGQNVYVLLCHGYSSGVAVVAIVKVNERGDVRFENPIASSDKP
jgi:hypothetical protein